MYLVHNNPPYMTYLRNLQARNERQKSTIRFQQYTEGTPMIVIRLGSGFQFGSFTL